MRRTFIVVGLVLAMSIAFYNLGFDSTSQATPTSPIITVEKTFNAWPEKVWQVLTERESVQKWWGPTSFTTEIMRHDFRESGTPENGLNM